MSSPVSVHSFSVVCSWCGTFLLLPICKDTGSLEENSGIFEKTEHFLSKPKNISLFAYCQNGAFSQVFTREVFMHAWAKRNPSWPWNWNLFLGENEE